MITTLIKALDTNDLKTVIGCLSMSPLDIDLVLYKAQEDGEIEVDKAKGKVKVLKLEEAYYDAALAQKFVDTMRFYDRQGTNVTRGRLTENALDLLGASINAGDPKGRYAYPVHDFITTLHALQYNLVPNMPQVYHYELTVPEIKGKRPYNKFEFFTLLDHQEFGAKAVNAFIDQFEKKKVK